MRINPIPYLLPALMLSPVLEAQILPSQTMDSQDKTKSTTQDAHTEDPSTPLPFGVSLGSVQIDQALSIDYLGIGHQGQSKQAIPSDLLKMHASNTEQHTETTLLKLDYWLKPYLNLYALAGQTQVTSVATVSIDSAPSAYAVGSPNWIIARNVHAQYTSGQLQNITFTRNGNGTTKGIGFTLCQGLGQWFALLDTHYTRTDFDVMQGSISVWSFSPRIGHRFVLSGEREANRPPFRLNLWVGTRYQDLQQNFQGSLSNVRIPSNLTTLATLLAKTNGQITVKQHLKSPWNALLGGQLEFARQFNLKAETSLTNQKSVSCAAEYRF